MPRSHRPFQRLASAVLAVVAVSLFATAWTACSGSDEPPAASQEEGSAQVAEQVAALQQRIDAMEKAQAAMEKVHAEERQLMIRALEASTERLDKVLAAISGAPSSNPGAPSSNTSAADRDAASERGDGTASTKAGAAGIDPKGDLGSTAEAGPIGEAGEDESFFGSLDPVTIVVIFLSVSLLALVVIVVFFPGRLRGSVPEVEYSAIEEEAIEGLQADMEPTRMPKVSAGPADAVAAWPTSGSRYGGVSSSASGAVGGGAVGGGAGGGGAGRGGADEPVPHELALHLDDPEEITEFAKVLDSYLSTEPYILNEPAPQVAFDQNELHLRFFALPTLSEAEHELLDTTVRRLRPEAPRGDFGERGPGSQRSAG